MEQQDDPAIARHLLERGADPNAGNPNGYRPLRQCKDDPTRAGVHRQALLDHGATTKASKRG